MELSMASSSVYRGRTPRNRPDLADPAWIDDHGRPAAEPREIDGAVHRQPVVVPTPPWRRETSARTPAPRPSETIGGAPRPPKRLVERRSIGGHAKNSFAPARIDCRISQDSESAQS